MIILGIQIFVDFIHVIVLLKQLILNFEKVHIFERFVTRLCKTIIASIHMVSK